MAARILLVIVAVLAAPKPADARCPLRWQIFPLPMWATAPNEGSTWGVIPILMTVCRDDKRTLSIFAPSVSWNSTVHVTGTVRWFAYFDDHTELSVIASASTRHNYLVLSEWRHTPPETWTWTHEASLRIDRNVFLRFFGIGPDTGEDDESSYRGKRIITTGRIGLNLGNHINVGGMIDVSRQRVQDIGIGGLPRASEAFPDAPGIATPSTILGAGINLRYDHRDTGDFSSRGTRVELWGGPALGASGSPNYLRGGAAASTIVPELDWLSGAARVYWAGVSSSSVPFYAQPSLGGSYLMRGFTLGRFVDRMAWTAEVEQRVRLVQTHFFGVVADWRIDPFVAVGQVSNTWSSMVSNPRVTVGAGLRAFVHPNVLGRIDLAYAGEGLNVYVEIGYPY
jgi:outer membrane protein assembly factor BamA